MVDKKVCVITGGTGFLGCHVARKFLTEGYAVRLYDLLPLDEDVAPRPDGAGGNAPTADVGASGATVEVIIGDVRDAGKMAEACRGADVVVHAAAALPIKQSRQYIFDVNLGGMESVLEGALHNGVRKLIFISTTAVYGVPKVHPLVETMPLVPVGDYGASKVESEKLCDEYRQKGLDVGIIRPKTFIGPGRLGVFQILFEWIREGRKIPLIGDGSNRYQLLAVSDLVDAIFRVATLPCRNETFNVGAKEFKTVREELEGVIRRAGTTSRLISTPAPLVQGVLRILELLRLSPLAEWHYKTANTDSYVSIEKAEKMLDWHPRKSNLDALIENYDWYAAHYQEYLNKTGETHRVPWNEKILSVVKRFM